MRKWEDIEALLKGCPKSTGARIPIDEDKELYHETIDKPFAVECQPTLDDFTILGHVYDQIIHLKELHKDKTMYVRVYPEIVMRKDGSFKDAYMRLQFIDKETQPVCSTS